jgi:hypothetical protein
VKNGAVELQLPNDDSLELILKAVPQSLAEEIIMAAQNAEAVPEPVSEQAAEELAEELAQESAEDGLETVTETTAEESAERFEKQYVDPKDIDAAEKQTYYALRNAIRGTSLTTYFVGKRKKRQEVPYPGADLGFLQVPLADPAIKLAVGVLRFHNTKPYADTCTVYQAFAATNRPAHARPRGLVCHHRRRPYLGHQNQARAQEALPAMGSKGKREIAQRHYPPIQANTNSQAQGGWQMEGDRGGAHQQRSSCHWQQVPGRKDH